MSYPTNRLIVGGVDLSTTFKMVLSDGYELSPPEPKTYIVDIPGGNGSLDLTESLMGDSVYKNRKQEFTFYIIDDSNFEKTKTDVSNFLHGKEFDYQMTMDPGYTYHGRFSVSTYQHKAFSSGILGAITVTIDARPFKFKTPMNRTVDAIGGITVDLQSGRMRVRPSIITNGFLKVIYNNKLLKLQQGSWAINDLLLTQGSNNVYFNTYDVRTLRWKDLKNNSVTWSEFKNLRIYEWYKLNGTGIYETRYWHQLDGMLWSDVVQMTWADLQQIVVPHTEGIEDINVQYEWGDL